MRILSLWQPWATLCVAPHPLTGEPPKRHETRSWAPCIPLPFTVAIHATAKWGREAVDAVTYEPNFRRALNQCGFFAAPSRPKAGILTSHPGLRPLPVGAIIGIAHVVEVVRTESLADGLPEYDRAFGDYSPGRFAWRLDAACMLDNPIPFKGRQQALYLIPPEIKAQIDAQLQGVVS